MELPSTENDPWLNTCKRVMGNAAQRARKHVPLPDGEWDRWCLEMESREEFLSYSYFPSDGGTLSFGTWGGFTHETPEQTAWRNASNRMKRAIDLFKKKADSVADGWGRWSTNRGVNQSAGRLEDW